MDHEQVLYRLFGRHCPAGEALYAEGSPGEELFVVQSGAVRVRPDGVTGGEVRGPGRILGEEAFFGRVSRAGRADAVRDSRLLGVSDRTLAAVVRHGPGVACTVADGLLELSGEAARRLDAWMLARLAERVAPHLRTAGPLPAGELAELAGIAVGDAAEVLEKLAAGGALAREPGGYRVTETAALEQTVQALAAAAA